MLFRGLIAGLGILEPGRIKEAGSLIFSHDSQRVAYIAHVGNKRLVVLNGEEGKEYDGIITARGESIIFDSPDSLHYLAAKGNSVYLVEERIK